MIDLKTEVYRICEFVESVVKRFDPKYDIPNKVKNEQIQKLKDIYDDIGEKYEKQKIGFNSLQRELYETITFKLNEFYQTLLADVIAHFKQFNNSSISDIKVIQQEVQSHINDIQLQIVDIEQKKEHIIDSFKYIIDIQGKLTVNNMEIQTQQKALKTLENAVDKLKLMKAEKQKQLDFVAQTILQLDQQKDQLDKKQDQSKDEIEKATQRFDEQSAAIILKQQELLQFDQDLQSKNQMVQQAKQLLELKDKQINELGRDLGLILSKGQADAVKLEEYQNKQKAIREQQIALDKEISDIQAQIHLKQQEINKQMIINQQLMLDTKTIKEKQKQLNDLQIKQQELESQLNEQGIQMMANQQELQNIQQGGPELESLQLQIQDLNNKLQQGKAQLDADRVRQQEQIQEQMKQVSEVARLKQIEQQKIQEQEDLLKQRNTQLNTFQAELDKLKNEVNVKTNALDALKSELIQQGQIANDANGLIENVRKRIAEYDKLIKDLENKKQLYITSQTLLKDKTESLVNTITAIVNDITSTLSNSPEHKQFSDDINALLAKMQQEPDIQVQIKLIEKLSELIQQVADNINKSQNVIDAILSGMLANQNKIQNGRNMDISDVIMGKLSLLQSLLVNKPGEMRNYIDKDSSTKDEKQLLVKNILDCYSTQVFGILTQINSFQQKHQQLQLIMTNLNTITDKDILTQITSEINEFRVMIEHTQSRLIIQLFTMFHLFLVPLNIFKAKPEEVKLKFIKYIENNLKSIVEHKEHMDKLQLGTSVLQSQIESQMALLASIQSNNGDFTKKYMPDNNKGDNNWRANAQQLFLNKTQSRHVLRTRLLNRIDEILRKAGKFTSKISDFQQLKDEFKRGMDTKQILNNLDNLRIQGLNINELSDYVDTMVDKTILHLVDPFDKTWNNIAEHAISIIPDLFNYSLFVMSNILDIMVLNNNINDQIEFDYVKILQDNFVIQLDKDSYQYDTHFTEQEKVIHEKLDSILTNQTNKSQDKDLRRFANQITEWYGINIQKKVTNLLNSITKTSQVAKQLQDKLTKQPVGQAGKGASVTEDMQVNQLFSLLVQVSSA